MCEERLPVDPEQELAARRLAQRAAQTYIDQFEGYEGSMVTGWLMIMETALPGQTPLVTWVTGDGAEPTEGDDRGLARHRVRMLVEDVRETLLVREIADEIDRRR